MQIPTISFSCFRPYWKSAGCLQYSSVPIRCDDRRVDTRINPITFSDQHFFVFLFLFVVDENRHFRRVYCSCVLVFLVLFFCRFVNRMKTKQIPNNTPRTSKESEEIVPHSLEVPVWKWRASCWRWQSEHFPFTFHFLRKLPAIFSMRKVKIQTVNFVECFFWKLFFLQIAQKRLEKKKSKNVHAKERKANWWSNGIVLIVRGIKFSGMLNRAIFAERRQSETMENVDEFGWRILREFHGRQNASKVRVRVAAFDRTKCRRK